MTIEPTYRKSSYSGGNGNCVEVADLPGQSRVRDSQYREAGHIEFSGGEWSALLAAARTKA